MVLIARSLRLAYPLLECFKVTLMQSGVVITQGQKSRIAATTPQFLLQELHENP
jgi:hypothetical protein